MTKLYAAKLFLVCYPFERKVQYIAALLGCSVHTVYQAMNELNINQSKKPVECKG